jgi:hypothetical protein
MIYQIKDIDQLLRIIGQTHDRIDAIQRLLELLPQDSAHRSYFLNLI